MHPAEGTVRRADGVVIGAFFDAQTQQFIFPARSTGLARLLSDVSMLALAVGT